jgi:hypothetical protein
MLMVKLDRLRTEPSAVAPDAVVNSDNEPWENVDCLVEAS